MIQTPPSVLPGSAASSSSVRRRAIAVPVVALGVLAGSAFVALSASAQVPAPTPIVIDGNFEDWTQRPTLLVDPADAPDAALDIGRVAVDDDPHWLHFLIGVRRAVTLQQLDGRLLLLLDVDADERTGMTEQGMAGVDLVVTFTPPHRDNPDRPGMGVGVEWLRGTDRVTLSPYDFELAFAPTIASDMFEIRLSRTVEAGDRPTFDGRGFRGRWVFLDRNGRIADATDTFTHQYATAAAPYAPPNATADPLARARGTVARVVSWNLEFGANFNNPDPFARVLRALAPDVILFQELNPQDTAERLHGWLTTHVPGRNWSVTVGAAGGNLRTGIASTLPMREISALERVTYQRGDRTRDVRTSSATIDVGGVPTLFMSIHLKCCGRLDGPEDLQRLEETSAIFDAMSSVAEFGSPIVVGGDYNLVGGRGPMRPLRDDWGLAKANILHLDGRGVATWFDPDSRFTPGRLDYVLYCGSSLAKLNGFVFDTRHLAPRWLQRHGLERDDVRGASDHFPLVLDLAPRQGAARGGRPAPAGRR